MYFCNNNVSTSCLDSKDGASFLCARVAWMKPSLPTRSRDRLHTSFYALSVYSKFWHCHFFFNKVWQLLRWDITGEHRFMDAFPSPVYQIFQFGCLCVDLWHLPGSRPSVSKLTVSTNFQNLFDSKLSVLSISTCQHCLEYMLRVSIPCSGFDMWHHKVLYVLVKVPHQRQLFQNVVGTFNPVFVNFDLKPHWDIYSHNKLYNALQVAQNIVL